MQNNKKVVNFNIWEGIYSNFEMAEKYKKNDGFSSIRYVTQARQAAIESFIKIKEKKEFRFFISKDLLTLQQP